jgi:hypothetical protein
MKCANPACNGGIGLVHYRRGWFNKRRYCSKNCGSFSSKMARFSLVGTSSNCRSGRTGPAVQTPTGRRFDYSTACFTPRRWAPSAAGVIG